MHDTLGLVPTIESGVATVATGTSAVALFVHVTFPIALAFTPRVAIAGAYIPARPDIYFAITDVTLEGFDIWMVSATNTPHTGNGSCSWIASGIL
jgi:hypothetical protein